MVYVPCRGTFGPFAGVFAGSIQQVTSAILAPEAVIGEARARIMFSFRKTCLNRKTPVNELSIKLGVSYRHISSVKSDSSRY
ncbi:MAG: hypothetical protein K0S38_313 [Candidatus Paceibacter sp.]|jgi:hypothetical protein|nr:hypothetical protein [Candidatus Paceibacter sp.]